MRFVIIASPRTGSSHLVNVLSGHPEIFCNGNALHPQHVWLFWPAKDFTPAIKRELRELREQNVFAFLERLYSTGYGRPHVGFKIFARQHEVALWSLVGDPNVRKVILYRSNVLANYASDRAARKVERWGAQEGKEMPESINVRFERDDFVAFHDRYVTFYKEVLASIGRTGQYAHLIEYREINDPLLLESLITFIGADSTKPISREAQFRRYVKLNSPDIVSRFENPDDVRAFLEENGLMHWAYEGQTQLDQSMDHEAATCTQFDVPADEIFATPGGVSVS